MLSNIEVFSNLRTVRLTHLEWLYLRKWMHQYGADTITFPGNVELRKLNEKELTLLSLPPSFFDGLYVLIGEDHNLERCTKIIARFYREMKQERATMEAEHLFNVNKGRVPVSYTFENGITYVEKPVEPKPATQSQLERLIQKYE